MANIVITDSGVGVDIHFNDKAGAYRMHSVELPYNSSPIIIDEANENLLIKVDGQIVPIKYTDVDTPTSTDAEDLKHQIESFFFKAAVGTASQAHWTRNPDWLPLPSINTGSKKFYGLLAVFENDVNELSIQAYNATAASIDWGDGVAGTLPNTVTQNHTYNYAALTGDVCVDEYGHNYKQVIVEILFTNTTTLNIDRNGTYSPGNVVPWLDIVIDNIDISTFNFSQQRKSSILERIIVKQHAITNPNTAYNYLGKLKVIDFQIPLAGNFQGTFQYLGDALQPDETGMDLISDTTTQFNSTYNNSMMRKFGYLSSTTATSANATFASNLRLEEAGDSNLPAVTNLTNYYYNCVKLVKKGIITTSAALLVTTQMFSGCRLLENVHITDCSGVNTATNMFSNTGSIRTCILTGMTISVNLSNNMMDAAAIDALFTSLGTAVPGATITVTGNPGAATCNAAIATAKGWTVVL